MLRSVTSILTTITVESFDNTSPPISWCVLVGVRLFCRIIRSGFKLLALTVSLKVREISPLSMSRLNLLREGELPSGIKSVTITAIEELISVTKLSFMS